MYRSRVGLDLIGNRYLHDKAVEWHKRTHRQRMDNIYKRRAGTGTLDNNCPESIRVSRGWRTNGRPKYMKEDRYRNIQKQNKRMTRIMTTGTDLFDYDDTHRDAAKRGCSDARRQKLYLISKHNKRLIHILENVKPFYNVEQWEEDRARKEAALKWMAKVHYTPSADNLQEFGRREVKHLHKELEERRTMVSRAPEPTPESGDADARTSHDGVNGGKATTEGVPEFPDSAGTDDKKQGRRESAALVKKKKNNEEEVEKEEEHYEEEEEDDKTQNYSDGSGAFEEDGDVVEPAPPPTVTVPTSVSTTVAKRTSVTFSRDSSDSPGTNRRSSSSRSGHLNRIREAQQAASGGLPPAIKMGSSSKDLQQVAEMYEAVERNKSGVSFTRAGSSKGNLALTANLTNEGTKEEVVSTFTKKATVKGQDGELHQYNVEVVFSTLADDRGIKVVVDTAASENNQWSAETTLSMDDARTILSLNQKKKGPVSKPELCSLVIGLNENFELVETGGAISIIFRTKLEFSNEDQFFSMVNKNLTALQQLYTDQSKEIRRSSIAFVGSDANQLLLCQTRRVPIVPENKAPLPPGIGRPLVREVPMEFSVQHPLCGEVVITGRPMENLLVPTTITLKLKTRVPTIALANRSAAVDYVTKVIQNVNIVKSSSKDPAIVEQEGWKLEINTD